MKKYFRWPTWVMLTVLIILVVAALVPTVPLLHGSKQAAHANGASTHPTRSIATLPPGTRIVGHPKSGPTHKNAGVDRSHLPSLATFTGLVHRAGTNTRQAQDAFIGANQSPSTTTTLFFDNMESGSQGWTLIGDSNGHSFWNLANNPQSFSVPGAVNPLLVSYPDIAGTLPAAYSGTHAWWYGDNPNVDPQPSTATSTYMGNESTWPIESSGDGGTSSNANSGSLISPTIDLTSVPNATLSFATWWEIEGLNPAHFDMMYIDVSTNNGSSWTNAGVLNPTTNPLPSVDYFPLSSPGGPYAYPYTNNELDVPASWHIASANLTPYVGHKIQIRFRFDSIDQTDNGFRGWFIDDVGVYSSSGKQPQVNSITPNTGMAGNTITITGTGFGAKQGSSSITFNGVNALVKSWGNYAITAVVPAGVTSGPVIVTVNGIQTAAINFTVTAQMSFYPPYIFPGSSSGTTVSAQGFAPNESVDVYLNGVNGSVWFNAVANNTGSILVSSVPAIPNMPYGIHLALAVGQKSHTVAGVGLLVEPALSASATTIAPGQTFSMTGHGYAPNETIQVQVDFNSNMMIGDLSCDGNGDCAGNVTLPVNPSPGTQDVQHHLLGIQASAGVGTSTPVTFTPAISLSPTSLAPGSYITVTGGAFTSGETVQIYLGSTSGTLEGTTTTDNSGGLFFSFQLPSTLPYGQHQITIARTSQIPATVVSHFQVIAPKLTSTAGIRNGQSVQIHVSGFQGNEEISISWNANGGQNIYSLTTDYSGSWSGSFIPPFAPAGSYTLTATGTTSGFQATSKLSVGPGILVSPDPGNPGAILTVTGGGYLSGETVHVYFQNPTNFVTATVNTTGAFTATLTVPLHYDPSVSYYVYANSTTSQDHARTPFTYIPPQIFANNQVAYGTPAFFDGGGFASNEQVNLYWDYGQIKARKVGTVTADINGTFTYTLQTPPSEPNLGNITLAAIGATSHLRAIGSTTEFPGLIAQPTNAPVGAKVHITGGSFGSQESVTVAFNGTTVATGTTNSDGLFTTTFIVPNGTASGNYQIQATGNTSGATGNCYFTVDSTVVLTPNQGPSGTKITVDGNNFNSNTQESMYWYDPNSGTNSYLGSVTTSSTGTFTTSITAPSNLISGSVYYVQVFDGMSPGGSTTFTAQ